MQNLQTITEIFSKQCSRCKKTQHICQFVLKGDRTEYKTCRRCRKLQDIDINHPGSSNDHLNIAQVIEGPIVKEKLVEEAKIEKLEEAKIEKLEEVFKNDNDPCCMTKISEIFSEYGYKIKPLTLDIIDIVFLAMGRVRPSTYLIKTMVDQKYVAVSESEDGVNLLFPPDDETVYLMNLTNTNLINNYTSK